MNRMRQELARLYSVNWVNEKSDAQVIAIYKRLQSKGKIKV